MKKATILKPLNVSMFFVMSVFSGWFCHGQISLVKEIRPGQFGGLQDNPEFVVYNNELYFFGDDGIHGKELWKTDGTEANTVLVKDILEGSGSSFPSELTLSGSTLYFIANDGVFGRELWKTDGTEDGTMMVKDINSSSAPHLIGDLFDYNGTLVFRADDSFTGLELWKSNGTENTTILIKDIFEGGIPSTPNNFAVHNGYLYFSATGSSGTELYRTTGDELSTELVKDLYTGGNAVSPNSSFPSAVISLGNNPYFSALVPIPNTNDVGRRLCVVEANFLFNSISGDPFPELLTKSGGLIYYRSLSASSGVGRELFASNGSGNENTFNLVKDIRVGSASSNPSGLTDYNDMLMFRADDGIHGIELWKSNGSEEGTVLVKDIYQGPEGSFFSNAGLGSVSQNILFFTANDGIHGNELWISDGTEIGTNLVMDLNIGTGASDPFNFTEFNGAVYFSANNGVVGRELFKVELNSLNNSVFENLSVKYHFDKYARTLIISDIENTSNMAIYNLTGSEIFQMKLQRGENKAALHNFKDGVYIVRIQSNRQLNTFKIMVH